MINHFYIILYIYNYIYIYTYIVAICIYMRESTDIHVKPCQVSAVGPMVTLSSTGALAVKSCRGEPTGSWVVMRFINGRQIINDTYLILLVFTRI